MYRKYSFRDQTARIAAQRRAKYGCANPQRRGIRPMQIPTPLLLFAAAVVTFFCQNAAAAPFTWNLSATQSGDWSVASNWSSSIVPLSIDAAYINNGGTATITLAGAACSQLSLDGSSASTIVMSDGQLSVINVFDSGTFYQSGGTSKVRISLYVGYTSSGTYNLTNGQLSAQSEYLQYFGSQFQQSGGSNATGNLTIGSGNSYTISGGTLLVNGSLVNQGVFDGGGGTGSLYATNSVIDLSQGTVQNTGSMLMNIDSNSLLIVPAGFSLATGFGALNAQGLTHVAGTTLVVPSGKEFTGQINIIDPVNCQGYLLAPTGDSISLNNGLVLSGSGIVGLGNGSLTVNDSNSGLSGGSLSASAESIGTLASGMFSQSGGSNTVATSLVVSKSSVYVLSGGGLLKATQQYIGNGSPGAFTQSGGTNVVGNSLNVGYTSTGSCSLSGNGVLSAPTETVGNQYNSQFLQSGGSNVASSLTIGKLGHYVLSGGSLSIKGGLINQGIFDGGGGSGSLYATSAMVDLSQGIVSNAASMSVNIDANSLLVVPAGFNLANGFGTLNSQGLTYTIGTTFVVSAGKSFAGQITINDPVSCQGAILATSGTGIKLGKGLTISGTGMVLSN